MSTCATPVETILSKTTDILKSSALDSGPMSLLCEFIEREIKDVIDTDPIDLDGAVSEANRALNRAYQELDDLIVSMRSVNESLKAGQSRIEACIEQIEQLANAPIAHPRPSQ